MSHLLNRVKLADLRTDAASGAQRRLDCSLALLDHDRRASQFPDALPAERAGICRHLISGGRPGDGNTWRLEYHDPYPGLIHDFLHCFYRFVQIQRICLNDPAYADTFQYLLDTHLGHHFTHHRLSGSWMRLVSLGMRCWQDIEQYGLRIWFTDPDTGSILHLSRSWPRSEQENSPAATRRLFSFQAGALAGGQIVSQAAKRSADGELLLATRNRLSSVVPLSPDAWQMLSAPLRQPGIVALREYLRQRPPACIRPLNQVDNLFILPVAECISLGWDSSRQTLDAQVISGEGEDNLLTLSLPASACSPFAVERMAALLQQTDDPVSLVSGFVSFVEGQLTLEPRVMMTKTRAWALDAETAPVAPLPSASVLPVPSTAHQLLMRCQALLIQLLHNGWRYQEQSAIGQAELLANDLTAVVFYRLAHVLAQFRNTESEARVEAMNNGVLLCEQLFPMLQQQG